ncbi:MAG: hypothetical protein ACWA5L_00495 [bacterium]
MLRYIFLAMLISFSPVMAEETGTSLQRFAPYIGKTFTGKMQDGSIDIQKWEKILGGEVLRITHSLNEGEYGGETLIYVDKQTDALQYVYVTTAGFRTEGQFTIAADGSWTAYEEVKGHEKIKAVRSSGSLDDKGRLLSSSVYINKDGTQTKGHSFIYEETPDAELKW